MKDSILKNRELFLSELKSGKYKKGTIKSDDRGNPVFDTEADKEGSCACGVMAELFGKTDKNKISLPKAMKALGISSKACQYIQKRLNDTDMDFNTIADRIQANVFDNHGAGMASVMRQEYGLEITPKERKGIRKVIEDFKQSGKTIVI